MSQVILGNQKLRFIKSMFYTVPRPTPIKLYSYMVDAEKFQIYSEDSIKLLELFENNSVSEDGKLYLYLQPGQLYIDDIEIQYIYTKDAMNYEFFTIYLFPVKQYFEHQMINFYRDNSGAYLRGTININNSD